MQLNNKFKIVWWVFLLLGLLTLIITRYKSFVSESVIPFDYLILSLFIVLAFLPFFTELNMFGFKLKKEIKEVKDSVESGVDQIKSVLLQNNNTNRNQIYLSQPDLSEEQLEQLKQKIIKDNSGVNAGDALNVGSESNPQLKIDPSIERVIHIRYLLEKEIRRISVSYIPEPNNLTVSYICRNLLQQGIIDISTNNGILEVYKLASHAIHANKLSREEINFVLSVGPAIIEKITEL